MTSEGEENREAIRLGELRLSLDDLIRKHGWDDVVWMLRVMADDESVNLESQGRRT